MLPGGGRSGDMPTEQELAERLQQANISGPWQAGVAFPGQLATAYAVPYGVAAPFPQQAQPGFALTPQGQIPAPTAQYSQPGSSQSARRPGPGSRPASAPGQRPALQSPSAGIRPSGPQYAAFYPQFQAAYPMQYLPPAAAYRPMPAQQLQPFQARYIQPAGIRAQFQFPGAQFPGAAAFQQPPRQGRTGGRQPQRGRFSRGQPDPNRGRGQGQYRAMWQQVTQVCLLRPF